VDDLDHTALACGGTTPPRSDMQELRIFGGGEGTRRRHAGKNTIGFGHMAPDEAGVAKSRWQRHQTPKKKQSITVSTKMGSAEREAMRVRRLAFHVHRFQGFVLTRRQARS